MAEEESSESLLRTEEESSESPCAGTIVQLPERPYNDANWSPPRPVRVKNDRGQSLVNLVIACYTVASRSLLTDLVTHILGTPEVFAIDRLIIVTDVEALPMASGARHAARSLAVLDAGSLRELLIGDVEHWRSSITLFVAVFDQRRAVPQWYIDFRLASMGVCARHHLLLSEQRTALYRHCRLQLEPAYLTREWWFQSTSRADWLNAFFELRGGPPAPTPWRMVLVALMELS